MTLYRHAIATVLCAATMPFGVWADTFVYVAAAGQGVIDSYRLDEETGALTPLRSTDVGAGVGPMAISPQGTHLYAAMRSQPYRVLTLGIDPRSGALMREAVAALPENLAYIALDPSGRTLLGASYGGGKVATLPVGSDGIIDRGTHQLLPAGRNAHAIITDQEGRFAYSTALGTDEVITYRLDEEGLLVPLGSISTGKGSGPRHMVLSPDGGSLYVLTELSGEVLRFGIDRSTGTLAEVQRVSILPIDTALLPGLPPTHSKDDKARVWAADLALTPDGRHLYATERTTSRVSLLEVNEGGSVHLIETYPTEQQPRDIALDPRGRFLITTGEKSDHVAVYEIAPEQGRLTLRGRAPVNGGANWVEILQSSASPAN